ncbi:MAG: tyrosine--tRNA ligase [Pirellulales bacterium]|nr:tyrosine--tRNA ligase [Pirellulales bacterium]
MQDIFAELSWRGLIHQTTDDANLQAWLMAQSRTVYAGFDPTADSLHVGHLLPLSMLRRFQRAGHKPIAIVGGATGMIGDPSGKSKERNLLTREQLIANVESIEVQMRGVLDFECGQTSAVLVNNFDWMQNFSYLDFLRDVGKNFPVNVMLAKDSVKGRLEKTDAGMSYTEFSYMLLQAYDFVHLSKHHGCELQIGGSDQWGNITAGIDLARRMLSVQLYGLTCPLLTKSDGTKMGKTEAGAIWLSPERTSPYRFYQYWINVGDDDVSNCLRVFTDLNQDDVESLDKSRAEEPHKRESQRRLAEELTKLVHGDSGLQRAQRATQIFFGQEIDQLSDAELGEIFEDVPSKELPRDRLSGDGLGILDAFHESGLASSKGDARRAVQEKGTYLNNARVEDIGRNLTVDDLISETSLVLRRGKKKYAILRFV